VKTVFADVSESVSAGAGLFSRTRRAEILCMASADEIADWVDELIDSDCEISVRRAPEVGVVMLQIQEPVANDNFYLGEVLVTRSEVEVDGFGGWSMRMGDDPTGALACALIDAWAVSSIEATNAVDLRCALVLARCWEQEIVQWEELRKTEVRFDELESDRAQTSSR
jgi:alpha-D-ribose 1-methylphosphonate 5-triphosphate synthase subunit PhnG